MLNRLVKSNFNLVCVLFSMILGFKTVEAYASDTRYAELEYVNKKLNHTYQKILHRLDPSEQEKLKKAERAWIVFRDLDCSWVKQPALYCEFDRTESREKELRESYFFDIKRNYLTIGNEESERLNKDKK